MATVDDDARQRGEFGALVGRHLPGLFAFVRARAGAELRARDATIDLVQSACCDVLRDARSDAPLDEARFRQWLYLAVERKIVDRARYHGAQKRDRRREITLDEVALLRTGWAGLFTPSRDASAREELALVEAALDRLPADQREVIVLSRIAGLPHAQIAERLQRSEGAVRQLLHRALARLAMEIGE